MNVLSRLLVCVLLTSRAIAADRPNILWLSCEDISPHLGCYGYANATTPVLDEFAQRSVLFERAYTTAGVCAPCRSAIITGMYQTSIGTQHMRCSALLPEHVKPFTHWLRDAGYYCTNNSKEDYQFKTPKGSWDVSGRKAHWKNAPDDTPFFAVFNYGGCHESGIASKSKYEDVTKNTKKHDRNVVAASLPPYYPNTAVTREDWGRYYDVITAMDAWVGEHLQELDQAGEADNTIVCYWSDHGVGLPRAKRWLYESGTHVPLIIHFPAKWQHLAGDAFRPGTRSERLVSMIDMGPSMLSLAGVATPEHMSGRAIFGPHAAEPRDYIFGARDRMDERYDIIRMVRDGQFRYVRNYEPYKTWYQYMNTPEKGATMKEIRAAEGNAPAEGVAQFLGARKPLEELYDVAADPHEMHNLADDPKYADKVAELRQQHLDWVLRTRDLGLIPEAELHRLRSDAGSEWAILSEAGNADTLVATIRDAAVAAGQTDADSIPQLAAWLTHENATVRYWAATGLGNRDTALPGLTSTSDRLETLLDDESESVRVAAARAYAGIGDVPTALATLSEVLDNGSQWARVHAAIVLDEMEEQARPALDAMKRNKAYRDGFVANGKYTVRVLNKALNDLLNTSTTVP
ncbi:MAG: sulfatase-like hydrolase/transferase [Planctomycetaceae bacterium]|nr:sulfatase-like hydrolase/transferase [Planctomycetaceae bacterium]